MKKILCLWCVFVMVISLTGKANAQNAAAEQRVEQQIIDPSATLRRVPMPPEGIETLPVAIDSVLTRKLIQSGRKKDLDAYVAKAIQQAGTAEKKALVTAAVADTVSRISISRKDDTELQTQAIALYREALPSLTGAARLQTANNYATMLLKQNKATQALGVLRPLKTEYQHSSDTQGKTAYLYNLGRAYEKSGHSALARDAFQQAALVDPGFSPASRAVSRLLPEVAQDAASLGDTADWLNAVTDRGDLALAEKNIRIALVSPKLYTQGGFEKILLSFIRYLVEGECSPDRFESAWLPRLPPLESMRSVAQGMVTEVTAIYRHDFPVDFHPGNGLRYLRSIAAAARINGQPELPTRFAKIAADRFRAAGAPEMALQRYAMAWTIDTTNMKAAYGIVNVLFEMSEQTAGGSDGLLNRFIREVFELKGQAYKAPVGDDWENILRFHLVLGSIYSRKGKWGNPDDPMSAIFQLEHAVRVRSRLINSGRSVAAGPIAGVQYALANAYDKSGDPWKAGPMFLNAAESALAEKDKSYARQIIDEVETHKDRFHLGTRELQKIESLRVRTAQPETAPSPIINLRIR